VYTARVCTGVDGSAGSATSSLTGMCRCVTKSPGVDSTLMELSAPPITALDLHPRQMGAEAAVMLGAALDGQRQKNQATVPVVLRQRASTLRIR
jgi:hypothetical protein